MSSSIEEPFFNVALLYILKYCASKNHILRHDELSKTVLSFKVGDLHIVFKVQSETMRYFWASTN